MNSGFLFHDPSNWISIKVTKCSFDFSLFLNGIEVILNIYHDSSLKFY